MNSELLKMCLAYIQKNSVDLYRHSIRTANLSNRISEELCFKDSKLVRYAACLHDIGKLLMPDCILQKTGALNIEERGVINLHSFYGYKALKALGMDEDVANVVLLHHGEDMPRFGEYKRPEPHIIQAAQIIQIADVYDALTSKRSYHDALSEEKAIEIMKKENKFEPVILDILISLPKEEVQNY